MRVDKQSTGAHAAASAQDADIHGPVASVDVHHVNNML